MHVLENLVVCNANLFSVELCQVLSMKQINPMIIVYDSSLVQKEPLLSGAVTDLIWNFALIHVGSILGYLQMHDRWPSSFGNTISPLPLVQLYELEVSSLWVMGSILTGHCIDKSSTSNPTSSTSWIICQTKINKFLITVNRIIYQKKIFRIFGFTIIVNFNSCSFSIKFSLSKFFLMIVCFCGFMIIDIFHHAHFLLNLISFTVKIN